MKEAAAYQASEGEVLLQSVQNNGVARINQTVGTSDIADEQSSSNLGRDPENQNVQKWQDETCFRRLWIYFKENCLPKNKCYQIFCAALLFAITSIVTALVLYLEFGDEILEHLNKTFNESPRVIKGDVLNWNITMDGDSNSYAFVPTFKNGSNLYFDNFLNQIDSGEIPISDFTLVIKSGLPDFDEFALNFPLVSGKTMQNEIFELAFRRSENMVYFPREGCEDSDNISICEIGNDKLIIPAHFQNDTKHQHLGLYLKDSSNAIVGAFMKKTAEKFLESLNDKTDGCWELSSDGEGMKIIQVYQKC